MDLSSASKVDAENGERDSLLRRSEAGNGKVFVLPLRDRVLFPGLRAQALVHRSVYDAYVAHQRKLDDSTSLSKIITVGVKNDGEHEELHTVGTLCRMASSNALTTSQAGVDSNTHVILTLEGLDRVQLDLSTCIITYDNSPVDIKGTQQEGGRSVVCGKAEVSRILHSVQKGSSEEIEALAAGLQRKIAELFKVEKRLQTVTNGKFRQTGLPGPLGGLVASLWNDRSLGGLGEGGEKAITDVPIRAEKCSLFADIICATLKDVPMAARQKALECLSIEKRLHIAKDMVDERRESLLVANRVRNNIRRQADMDVRERVIRRQIQELQGELKKIDGGGGNEDELTMLTNKLAAIDLPKDMRSVCDRELHKMQNTPTTHPDYTVSRTYLETVASLPWALDTGDVAIDLEKARYVLDRDHFGMAKVKKRLMEYLAVVKLHQGEASSTVDEQQQQRSISPEEESGPSLVPSPSSRTAERRAPPPGPVMCLVGPPGVGKTSLCRSIAEALGKKFCRVSLGGVRDEAEIRGHRRTYIGSMLGTVLQELARCGSRECVMLLDETDKVAQPGFNSNAQAALLELLDPSQNATFRDHYLGVPFDLSCVTFICTANSASEMSRPLIDRLEMIEIPSYTLEEKREIAKRHLFPRQLKSHCLPTGSAGIDDDAIDHLIECYTKEAGVRSLERRLGDVCRYIAVKTTESNEASKSITIHRRELPDIVGPELFDSPTELSARRAKLFGQGQQIGVALGLAVTAAGGDVLEIETTITSSSMANGGSGKVSITGQLGEVMRESVTTAMAHLRARVNALQNTTAEDLPSPIESIFRSIDPRLLSSADVHVHFPAGAVPKDGPSAGVAVLLALVSLFTGIPIPPNIATTGEITLTGQVLTIGGVRDKALAAQRAGIDTIIIPRANARTLRASLPLSVLESLDMLFIDHIDEALMRVFKPSSDRRHSRSSVALPRPNNVLSPAEAARSAL